MGGADKEPLSTEAPDSSVRPRSDRCGPGTMITPSVRLERLLSEGGMGSIWLARHLGLDTDVAVKIIAPELVQEEPDFLERFRREAALGARIRSVHVVQLFDHGVMPDGTPYMVMELLQGKTMADVLDEKGRLDLRTTARIVAQLAKALHAVHVLGIVHRDLKPDNVFLVDADYEVFAKLLDFGIAKQAQVTGKREITKTGMGIGTPGYVSPEQAMNAKGVDHRADLWSLGALAYRALTGVLPFGDDDGDTHQWLVRLFRGELTPPSRLVAGLPPAVDDWFSQALHGVPDKRFPTARKMAEAFIAIVHSASSKLMSGDSLGDEPWATGEVQVPVAPEEDPPSTRPRAWSPVTTRLPQVDAIPKVHHEDGPPEPPTMLYRRPSKPRPATPVTPPPARRSRSAVWWILPLLGVVAAGGAYGWHRYSDRLLPQPLVAAPSMDQLAPDLPAPKPTAEPKVVETAEPIEPPPAPLRPKAAPPPAHAPPVSSPSIVDDPWRD